jgi:hypothetical protein
VVSAKPADSAAGVCVRWAAPSWWVRSRRRHAANEDAAGPQLCAREHRAAGEAADARPEQGGKRLPDGELHDPLGRVRGCPRL